ncbi:hypothetical protein DPMN_036716 [Dreissena polymorpha]|uniref:Uncharacterized protein n=1 Tax=Dreissena polymorpha TaxID=45954 RepID=A0A9D4RLQ1_DREPO|nr:hypothetical protein DPMN_036716 [Dreissena polymorpha]
MLGFVAGRSIHSYSDAGVAPTTERSYASLPTYVIRSQSNRTPLGGTGHAGTEKTTVPTHSS